MLVFQIIIIKTSKILNKKFNNKARKKTLAASLSFLGNMMASSYLNDEIIINIPIKLRYTAYAPKISGE